MKKTLLITLFLIPFLGMSQTTKPIDGFLGIKFGSNKATVLAAMAAKGAVLNKKHSDPDLIGFSNVKLGRRPADGFFVKFVNNKVYEADYFFKPDVEAHIINDYSDLIEDITRIYGKGESVYQYDSPYKAGESNTDTLVGLSVGKVDYHTLWTYIKNTMSLSIGTDMSIQLTYQDDKLTEEAIVKQNAKEKSEF